jgi:hypothetical protein
MLSGRLKLLRHRSIFIVALIWIRFPCLPQVCRAASRT